MGVLTYGRDHSDGEVEGSGELPLDSGFVRFELQDHELQILEVGSGQVVPAQKFVLSRLQLPALTSLLFGLQSLEDGRADHQVGEDADDEGESPGVLPLHGEELRRCARSPDGSRSNLWRRSCSFSTSPTPQLDYWRLFGLICHRFKFRLRRKRRAGQSHI